MCAERNALLVANRQLDAELLHAHQQSQVAVERQHELAEELDRAFYAREAVEADLTHLRANVEAQVGGAVNASQAAARMAFETDFEELRRRCEKLEAEKHQLVAEKHSLLAERTALTVREAAAASLAAATSPLRDFRDHGNPSAAGLPLSPRILVPDSALVEAQAGGMGDGGGEAPGYGGWKPQFVSPVEVKL